MKVIVKHYPKSKTHQYFVGVLTNESKVNIIYEAQRSISYLITPMRDFTEDGRNYGLHFNHEHHAMEYAQLLHTFLIERKERLKREAIAEKERLAAMGSTKPKILAIIPESWWTKLRVKFNV